METALGFIAISLWSLMSLLTIFYPPDGSIWSDVCYYDPIFNDRIVIGDAFSILFIFVCGFICLIKFEKHFFKL